MQNKTTHILTALLLVVFLVLVTDPFMIWMPPFVGMLVLLTLAVLLCVWGGFVVSERASDERELSHRMYASRAAYLSGMGVLTVALIVQGLSHHVDLFVALALGTMVVVKLSAHLYLESHR
jgi:uncharacterized RDD family membrane protein YckC